MGIASYVFVFEMLQQWKAPVNQLTGIIAITNAWGQPDSITYLKHLHSKDITVLDLIIP